LSFATFAVHTAWARGKLSRVLGCATGSQVVERPAIHTMTGLLSSGPADNPLGAPGVTLPAKQLVESCRAALSKVRTIWA
jgi:hypothetical protein